MKWFNVGVLAIGLGLLFTSPHLLTFPSRLFQPEMHEVGIDQVSILAIEVLSDEIIMLQIRVEPNQSPNALLPKSMPKSMPRSMPKSMLEKMPTTMLEHQLIDRMN